MVASNCYWSSDFFMNSTWMMAFQTFCGWKGFEHFFDGGLDPNFGVPWNNLEWHNFTFPLTNGVLKNTVNGFYKPMGMLRDVRFVFGSSVLALGLWWPCVHVNNTPLPLQIKVWCTTRARVVCGAKWRKGRWMSIPRKFACPTRRWGLFPGCRVRAVHLEWMPKQWMVV